MSAYTFTPRSMDYVRSYRTMLSDLNRYQRIIPRNPSKSRIYNPKSTVNTSEASPVFIPLFYAGEKGALGIWEKNIGTGFVKRRLDEEDRSYHALELSNPRNHMGTFISAPKTALQALHITLPHMMMVMKNYRRNFCFDILVMDSNAYRRRFSFATYHNAAYLKKYSFLCQVPLRLEIGWNEIHINLNELVKNTYKTSYVETIRIQIYANCKLRQLFFCDDRIIKGEVPIPSMRDFGNVRIIPLDYGPRTHPDGIEPGPEKKRNIPYIDPPAHISPSRLENDLKHLQRRRFTEVSKQRLALQPYKTYFRELLNEEKQKKKMANVITTALKDEIIAKAKKVEEQKLKASKSISDAIGNNGEVIGLSVTALKEQPSSSGAAVYALTLEKAPPPLPRLVMDKKPTQVAKALTSTTKVTAEKAPASTSTTKVQSEKAPTSTQAAEKDPKASDVKKDSDDKQNGNVNTPLPKK